MIVAVVLVACGGHPSPPERPEEGRFRKVDEELSAIGYVDGSREARKGAVGAVVHQPTALPGWNLYTSGHAPGAWLIDMDGQLVHSWTMAWDEVYPNDGAAKRSPTTRFWRRAKLLPDGGVLAIVEGAGIMRLGVDGRLIWAVDNDAHHDLEVVGDEVWTLTRQEHVVPSIDPRTPVWEDFLTVLALRDGRELRRWSLVEAAAAHGPVALTDEPKHRGDVLHTNTVTWLPEDRTVLLSMLATSRLGVFDPETGRLLRYDAGPYRHQHDPQRVGGQTVLFNNEAGDDQSRVVWLDGDQVVRTWGDGVKLWSATCGAVQPLPEGHLLVTESDGGRAWEIDASGQVAWAWLSPHRAGAQRKMIATLFAMERVPALPAALDVNGRKR